MQQKNIVTDPETGERLFSTNEVAEIVGLKPGTISYYVNQKAITPTRNERGVFFTRAAIDAFVATRRDQSGNKLVIEPAPAPIETALPIKGTLTSVMETVQDYLLLNQMEDTGCQLREVVDPGIRIWEITFPGESLCAMRIGGKTFIIKGNYLQWMEREIEIVNMG